VLAACWGRPWTFACTVVLSHNVVVFVAVAVAVVVSIEHSLFLIPTHVRFFWIDGKGMGREGDGERGEGKRGNGGVRGTHLYHTSPQNFQGEADPLRGGVYRGINGRCVSTVLPLRARDRWERQSCC